MTPESTAAQLILLLVNSIVSLNDRVVAFEVVIVVMSRVLRFVIGLLCVLFLCACGAQQSQITVTQPLSSDGLQIQQRPSPTPTLSLPMQITTPTPTPAVAQSDVPGAGSGFAPYGPPPAMTSEELQLTQQLFALINQNRASIGLYPFSWNAGLAAGARLHSWDMYHCGFSHTCPNGVDQCTRIADEGFTFTDCGENIGLAGPYPTPWGGVYAVQESMWNEPPTGWHRIHLTSTTLHQIGVGLYVAPNGWIWFTEDMIS